MINVQLTPDYRLTADERNFIVLERHIVDPTKAPNWERRLAEAMTEGIPLPDPSPREEWREIAYYGQRSDSLALALEFVAIRSATRGDAVDLAEFFAEIRAFSERISAAVNAAFVNVNERKLTEVSANGSEKDDM